MLDGNPMGEFPLDDLKAAAARIGYPCFLRTDLASAKHSGPKSLRVESPDGLMRAVFDTFEDNACKDIVNFTQAFMVREWIDIPAQFTAFAGLAIGEEWRFFADPDKGVLCHHFYWPEKAFRSCPLTQQTPDWAERLKFLSEEPAPAVLADLEAMALTAVRAVGHGSWSVDFARDRAGRYWLIDMALASASWHPEDCPRA